MELDINKASKITLVLKNNKKNYETFSTSKLNIIKIEVIKLVVIMAVGIEYRFRD